MSTREFDIWRDESYHAKQLAKWNTPKSQGGYKNDGFEEFPKMLYMARKNPLTGKFCVAVETDELSLDRTRVILDAQAFTKTCQLEVKDAEMEAKALKNGWHRSQKEAMQGHEDEVLAAATAAAERNYADRLMGERAKAEANRYELTVPEHVSVIPEAPKRRRGRPRKEPPQSA